jgi:hypothetical protein
MHPTQNPPTAPAPPDDLTPADVLGCAARYLELHDWYQGELFRDHARVVLSPTLSTPAACAYGAIMMAVFGRPVPSTNRDNNHSGWRLYSRSCAALDDYLTEVFPRPVYDEDGNEIAYDTHGDNWNDFPGRTCDEVTDALNAAAGYYDTTHAPTGGAR